MRYIVMSDIHGYYPRMKEALDELNFDAQADTLVLNGDLFDLSGYPLDELYKPVELMRYLKTLPNFIWINGNHDDASYEMLCYAKEHGTTNSQLEAGGTEYFVWEVMEVNAIDEFIEFFEKNARLRSLTVGGLLICHSGNVEDNFTGVELFKKIKNKDFSKPVVLGHMWAELLIKGNYRRVVEDWSNYGVEYDCLSVLEEQGIVTIVHCVCEGNYYKVYHNETNKLVAILLDNKIYDRKNKVGSLVIKP